MRVLSVSSQLGIRLKPKPSIYFCSVLPSLQPLSTPPQPVALTKGNASTFGPDVSSFFVAADSTQELFWQFCLPALLKCSPPSSMCCAFTLSTQVLICLSPEFFVGNPLQPSDAEDTLKTLVHENSLSYLAGL